jgi:hypothetical protein
MTQNEEFFLDSDSPSPPPPKRFCASISSEERATRKRKLEIENLQNIIDDEYDSEDNDSMGSSYTHRDNSKLEERIHYLKLELANKELEIIALKEAQEPLNASDKALVNFLHAINIVETNITKYTELTNNVRLTPFAELIRMETRLVKPHQDPNLNSLAGYIQNILMKHYTAIQDEERQMRDIFHNYLIFEKSKANCILFLKLAGILIGMVVLIFVAIYFAACF